jgi:hypothetical protein
MAALDQLAVYVNGIALGNPALITEAGFVPTKGNISPIAKPNQPQFVTLTRGLPGELYADCEPAAGVDSTGGILIANEPIPEGMGINELGQIVVVESASPSPGPSPAPGSVRYIQDLNKARRKKFTGLQIGVTYYLYMWAMNAGGVSPLSVGGEQKGGGGVGEFFIKPARILNPCRFFFALFPRHCVAVSVVLLVTVAPGLTVIVFT